MSKQDYKSVSDNKKYLECSTVKSGMFFTTREMKGLSEEYAEILQSYERTQSGLVKQIVNITGLC